jgi:hypothetical protein
MIKLVNTTGYNIDGGLKFTMDGKLEMIEAGTGKVLWTNGVTGGEMLFLQNDGNLVMYDIQERNIWHTGTDLEYCEKGKSLIQYLRANLHFGNSLGQSREAKLFQGQ